MSDLVKELLRGAETMFGEILNEGEPYNQPEHLVHMLLFRRFTEWQYEYCRAIGLLYEANCFQGAIPILRSLVEVTVAQILLQRVADFSVLLELLKGERVRVASALKQIGSSPEFHGGPEGVLRFQSPAKYVFNALIAGAGKAFLPRITVPV
jgi:hypothetical protein